MYEDEGRLESLHRKIIHISFSKSGGAGLVARQLAKNQAKLGADVDFFFVVESDLKTSWCKHPIIFLAAVIDRFIVSETRKNTLFSYFREMTAIKRISKKIPNDSILHLHWTPGAISLKRLNKLSKKNIEIIWTLHDMNPLTGGCHHSGNCKLFSENCSPCPQVKRAFQFSVKNRHKLKRDFARKYPRMIFVSPSSWLLRRAEVSRISSNNQRYLIRNPIDFSRFNADGHNLRMGLDIPKSKFVIGICANDLADTNKNVNFALNAISKAINFKAIPSYLIICAGKNFEKLQIPSNLNIINIGELTHEIGMPEFYRSLDILINPSLFENSPNVIVEASLCGIPTIAFRTGGCGELIDHGVTGYLYENEIELIEYLTKISNRDTLDVLKTNLRNSDFSKFEASNVAKDYLNLLGYKA